MKTIIDENRRGGKLLSYLLALLVASFSMCMCQNAVAFSVCAVGDSITRGASNFTAHRIALEKEFDRLGWIVEWKGTVKNASYGTTNPCEGYSGQNAGYISEQYDAHQADVVADVLLLHAGHNYDATSMSTEDIVAAVTNAHKRIISAARAKNDKVVILYAKVITSSLEKYSYIPTLNTAIGALGEELNMEASPVVVVDMADGWMPDSDCVSDGVHPTATGAAKMAKKWMAAINAQHDAGKIVNAPNITTDTTLSVDAQWDSVTVAANATLNLNGYKLKTGGVSGSGTIMSAVFDDSETPGKYGYELLEYVQTPASNSGYIDTGYTPNCTDRVETKVSVASVTGNEMIFSSRKGGSAGEQYVHFSCLKNASKFRFDRFGTTTHATSGILAADTPYEIIADFGSYRYIVNGGSLLGTTGGTGDFNAYTNIFLFATGNDQSLRASSCKMYYFRVFDKDGNLQVNMLPARKGGTAGFFDIVRKRFFTLSSGVLAAGGNISYEVLSYVKTPADNVGYVDTLYTPQETDCVDTKVSVASTSGNEMIFSSRTSGTAGGSHFSCLKVSNKFRFDRNTTGVATSAAITTNTPYAIVADFRANSYVVGDDTLTPGSGPDVFTPAKNISLFAASNDHSIPAKGCSMYYFRVTDTNGYERLNLIPARMTANGTIGFYDTVHNAFIAPTDGTLEAGNALLRDLTAPDGSCWASLTGDSSTTVANLFNDNFTYRTAGSVSRFYLSNKTKLPLCVDYDFGEGKGDVVNMYRIWGGGIGRSPSEWAFYGSDSAYQSSDETGWALLDTGSSGNNLPGIASENLADCCTRVFCNTNAYRYYRLKVTAGGSSTYVDFTQLEYFHQESTVNPGELHIDVAEGDTATNSTVRLAGDLKLVKSGLGSFTAAKAGQGYLGGTDVKAGEFVVGAPLSTALTMADASTLGFNFAAKDAAPLLTLAGGSAFPSTLGVAIYVGGDFALPGEGTKLTSGYDFSGATIDFKKTGSARRLTTDATGNLWVYGPLGFMLIFK